MRERETKGLSWWLSSDCLNSSAFFFFFYILKGTSLTISFKLGEQAFKDNKDCKGHYDPAIPQLPKPIDSILPHPVHQQ